MDKYYVFYVHDGDNVYERTCGAKSAAEERVKHLKTVYPDAFYFENEIPKDFEYFY